MKAGLKSLQKSLLRFFVQEEGGKKRVKKKNLIFLLSPLVVLIFVFGLMPPKQDTSFVEQTSRHLSGDARAEQSKDNIASANAEDLNDNIRGVIGRATSERSEQTNYAERFQGGTHAGREPIKYHAPQIIRREGADPERSLPIGTSFIGRLITAIDSRDHDSLVRVLVPYGASFNHQRRIEKNSLLFGTANYPGSGDKVYIKFSRGVFPDGREFKIDAQALSPFDYSPGLAGEDHDGAGERMMSTVGLTMMSGMSDVLVEKEVLGESAFPTPKSNLKNGFYNGLTKATQSEAERRAAKMTQDKDYITVEAGRDLIISLTETFKGENL